MKADVSKIFDIIVKALKIIILMIVILFCVSFFKRKSEEHLKKRDVSNITSMVVRERNRIIEMSAIKYCEDVIVFDTGYNRMFGRMDTLAVAILKGTATIGFDLAKMKKDDIVFVGDTLVVHLPEPEILDVVINPSDVELFDHKKGWDYDTGMPKMSKRGKDKLVRDAKSGGMMERAAVAGTRTLSEIFGSVCDSPVVVLAGSSPQPGINLPSEPAGR